MNNLDHDLDEHDCDNRDGDNKGYEHDYHGEDDS